jgi:hypothetical protein
MCINRSLKPRVEARWKTKLIECSRIPPGFGLESFASVAQRIEQEPSNLLVVGSIPARGTG